MNESLPGNVNWTTVTELFNVWLEEKKQQLIFYFTFLNIKSYSNEKKQVKKVSQNVAMIKKKIGIFREVCEYEMSAIIN